MTVFVLPWLRVQEGPDLLARAVLASHAERISAWTYGYGFLHHRLFIASHLHRLRLSIAVQRLHLLTQLSGVMRAAARLILQLYLEKVTFLTPSVASSTGLTSRACSFQTMRSRTSVHSRVGSSYLSKYCIPVSSIAGRSHLRSAASGDLFIPATNTVTIGPRAFTVACPAAWNSLLPELHDKSMSLMTFPKKLKTHLFSFNC